MFQKMSLSGSWELCWTEIGQGSVAMAQGRYASGACVSCYVPGDIHMALTDAGVIRDPLADLNSLQCKWLEHQEFWYRKKFDVAEDFLQDKAEIIFEGLDTAADIWLNGEYIGSHNNAFIEKIIDVSGLIKAGENCIVVRIDDGFHAVKDKPIDFMEHSWNAEQPYRAWMRKPQFVYGWDWTIWLPSCGIWRDVTLRSYHRAAIENINVRTLFEGERITEAESVTLKTTVEAEFLCSGDYTLQCEVFADSRFGGGEMLALASKCVGIAEKGAGSIDLEVTLTDPQLWWPNGSGKPYLYTVVMRILDDAGNVLQERRQRHGLRTVAIREDVLDEKSKSFTFVINGKKIFCKGANHVPADCFPGRITREKTDALLNAAAQAHMNMIRVWGGGIYESDAFMDACDALGLMVWHDFMFACAYYPDHDPEFYGEIRREAAAAIRRLRSHPSLVGWSGNNEIQEMLTSVRTWKPEHPWYGGRIYEELLPALVRELCPDRIYRESSPYGGVEPTSYDEGDQHTWHFTHRPSWEHYLDLWRFTDFDFKFLSEFGVIGAMNLESAKKCIRAEALLPQSPEWLHHTNTSQNHQLIDIFVRQYFPDAGEMDIQEYILKSQVLQAEIMRHIYDELRSRKFRCSGILLWTLSDSYGIHNWSVIDYYLGRRPVYYYLKRSMEHVNLAFRGYEVQSFDGMAGYKAHYREEPTPIALHVANDSFESKQIEVNWRVMTFDGRILLEETAVGTIAANSAEKFAQVDISAIAADFVPEETILCAQILENGIVVNENHYFFAPFGKLNLKEAKVRCEMEKISDNQTRLTLTSDTFVWMLHMGDMEGVQYSDNDFILLPGVSRTVILTDVAEVPPMYSLNPAVSIAE